MKKISTKEKIKEAAIELFNNENSLNITTNHIAKKANISPGNLYYHFKNKEEIILEIYKDMSHEFEEKQGFEKTLSHKNPLHILYTTFEIYNSLFWNYRFLMRDITTLINIYPTLKTIFAEKEKQRIIQVESIIRYLINENIFENIKEEEIHIRAKLNWFITAYWQTFIATSSKVDKKSIDEAKEVLFKTQIFPYLTNEGKELLKEI